ncbi:MAG TPA: DUF1573 domain-containing protein [Blastocatellia bacterium]|nr:DUF1573 domain-containing protein [Blastocatellia bacterium]
MKLYRTILALALLTVLAGVAVAGQKPQQPNPPSGADASVGPAPMLVIESLTHDFGEVKAGTPLRYAFKIKNAGKADLLINNVSPG